MGKHDVSTSRYLKTPRSLEVILFRGTLSSATELYENHWATGAVFFWMGCETGALPTCAIKNPFYFRVSFGVICPSFSVNWKKMSLTSVPLFVQIFSHASAQQRLNLCWKKHFFLNQKYVGLIKQLLFSMVFTCVNKATDSNSIVLKTKYHA